MITEIYKGGNTLGSYLIKSGTQIIISFPHVWYAFNIIWYYYDEIFVRTDSSSIGISTREKHTEKGKNRRINVLITFRVNAVCKKMHQAVHVENLYLITSCIVAM